MGWVVVGGGASTSLLCSSLYLYPRLAQVSEKAGRLFATRTRAGGQWIGSQRPFSFFLFFWKRETHTVASTEHGPKENGHKTHRTLGGLGWVGAGRGVCNCAPVCTCAGHSLTQSSSGCTVRENSGLNPRGHRTKGDWHLTHSRFNLRITYRLCVKSTAVFAGEKMFLLPFFVKNQTWYSFFIQRMLSLPPKKVIKHVSTWKQSCYAPAR